MDNTRQGRPPDAAARLAAAIEDCEVSIASVQQVWEWLAELAVPGREGSVPVPVDDERAEQLTAQAFAARAYRQWNLRRGMTALPPTRAAARIDVLDAQVAVHGLVHAAVRLVAEHIGETIWRAPRGRDPVYGTLCWLGEYVGMVRDVSVAQRAGDRLRRADMVARRAARVPAESTLPLEDRCPACQRRSLTLHYDPPDLERMADALAVLRDANAGAGRRTRATRRVRPRRPELWRAECVSESCRCAGEACGCRMRTRYASRRHAWAYGELGDLWRAVELLPRGEQVRSGGAGRGWR